MERNRPVGTPFREGDYVVLAEGTYPGTLGVFLRLKEDVNWADIADRSGVVRSHPVAWLEHAGATIPPAMTSERTTPQRLRRLNRNHNARVSEQQH